MYQPEVVNDIANWIVIAAVIPFALFTILYGVLAPWYKTLLGFVLFGLIGTTTAVLFFALLRRWIGAFPGYEWWAIGIYSSLTLFATAFLVIFFVERRRAPLLELSVKRRRTKEPS